VTDREGPAQVSLSLSLSLSVTHSHTHSLSLTHTLSLLHTHTHTHTHTRQARQAVQKMTQTQASVLSSHLSRTGLGFRVSGVGLGTYLYGKRDLCIWNKRPIYMEKETYLYLCIWQKRPMHMAKETCLYLCIWQKRPMHMVKETYLYGKRDLVSSTHRRITHIYVCDVILGPNILRQSVHLCM